MAEPFSIAASAIQVAGAGVSLAKTLHAYIDGVKSARKHIRAVAVEVKLTASVLEHLGALLKDSEAGKLCTQNVVSDAQDALSGLSATARFAWPFKKGKLEALQANLERLKSTLLLMLSVLSYAREKTYARPADLLSVQRVQIQNLIKAKDDATVRYEEMLVGLQMLATDDSHANTSQSTLENDFSPWIMASVQPGPTPSPDHRDRTALLEQLGLCATAVSSLAASVSTAMAKYSTHGELEVPNIHRTFKSVAEAVTRLLAFSPPQINESPATNSMDKFFNLPTELSSGKRSRKRSRSELEELQQEQLQQHLRPETGPFKMEDKQRLQLAMDQTMSSARGDKSIASQEAERQHQAALRRRQQQMAQQQMAQQQMAQMQANGMQQQGGMQGLNSQRMQQTQQHMQQQMQQQVQQQQQSHSDIPARVLLAPHMQAQQMQLQRTTSGNCALQDYQMQLMLLEQQDKKRLLMAKQKQTSPYKKIVQSDSQPQDLAQQQARIIAQQEVMAPQQRQQQQQRTDINAPFGSLDNGQFPDMNLDFTLEGGDVLDNFDFDSFLNHGGDGGFGFDANLAFGGGETDIEDVHGEAKQAESPLYALDEVDELIKRWTTVGV